MPVVCLLLLLALSVCVQGLLLAAKGLCPCLVPGGCVVPPLAGPCLEVDVSAVTSKVMELVILAYIGQV